MQPAIRVTDLSKRYKLGQTHATSVREIAVRLTDRLLGRKHALPTNARSAVDASVDDDGFFWALRDVSFDVQPGEVAGIIGRNGAGKSTLLKVLSRITSPTTGRVEINGRVASLLEVGTGFHPELTGRENVFLNGAILGMTRSEIRRKFDEIVGFAEIETLIDTPVKRYSSGMYVRLAFAVAAHLEPEILIIDEVLAVGDSHFQQRCLGKMGEVARGGRTVLFVSHNMAAVDSLCTTAHVFRRGRLAYSGETTDAIANYCGDMSSATPASRIVFPEGRHDGTRMLSASLRSNGIETTTLRAGDPLEVVVRFSCDTPIRRPGIGLTIANTAGTNVLAWNNYTGKGAILDAPISGGTIVCRLGSIPLVPKRYSITLYFGNAALHSHIEPDAFLFDVLPANDPSESCLLPPPQYNMWWPVDYDLIPDHESRGAPPQEDVRNVHSV